MSVEAGGGTKEFGLGLLVGAGSGLLCLIGALVTELESVVGLFLFLLSGFLWKRSLLLAMSSSEAACFLGC